MRVIFVNAKVLGWVDGGKNRDILFSLVGIALGIAFLCYGVFKQYPVDYDATGNLLVDPAEMIEDCYKAAGCVFGFFIGWLLERRFVSFDVSGRPTVRVIRGAVGAVLLALIALLGRKGLVVVLGDCWGELIFFTVAFVFILFVYPYVFTRIEKSLKRSPIENK